MKKAFLILSIIIFSNISFAQIVDTTNKLKVEINKNIELLGLAYFISFEGVDIEYKTVEIEGKKIQKKKIGITMGIIYTKNINRMLRVKTYRKVLL